MTETQRSVFDACHALLEKHVPPLTVLKDGPGDYQLICDKPAVIAGRKMKFVWFAQLKANKSDVTLHFMPVYMNEALTAKMPSAFMKALKGQACFHLGKFDEELRRATEEALRLGVEAFQSLGYF